MNNLLFTNIENLNHITLVIYVLLMVYIVFVIPNVNRSNIMLMNNLLVKLGVLFVIIYVSISNPLLAILISLSFILTLQELNKNDSQTTAVQLKPSKINQDAVFQVGKKTTSINNNNTGNYSLDAASSSCLSCNQKSVSLQLDSPPPNNNKSQDNSEGPEGYLGGYSVLDNAAQL